MRPYISTFSNNKELRQLNDRIASTFKPIHDKPILDGLLIENISLVSGSSTVITHGLGRTLRGYHKVKGDAPAVIWDSQGTNQQPGQTLILNTTMTTIISLWVF